MTDESTIGGWLLIGYFVVMMTAWYPLDWWLKRNGHEYMTTEFRELLQSGGPWPIVACFVVGGSLGAWAFHFFYQRGIG